jgi:hypothetical protein
MDIFYEGSRHCKKCQRDLPNDSLHFPYDKSCKDKLRNVCRECNPKYKRFLEVSHRTNEEWSDEDLELLESIYKDYTNNEIIEKFFPNRTIRSLETISSKYGFNHKSEKTLDRGRKFGAMNNPMCQKGLIFSEEHKRNISIGVRKRYENPEQRELARQNAIKRGLGVGDSNPIHINPLYGEKNGRWKGGASALIEQLRRDIIDWKKDSSEFCNYKCIFTGGRFQNIHHIISFNSLVDKALDITCLERRSKISDYSNEEYENLKTCLIELHSQTLFGACLCEELHELFHKEYTYYDSTIDDFVDFTRKVIDGYYDYYFNEKDLNKNIDYDYVNYLEKQIV